MYLYTYSWIYVDVSTYAYIDACVDNLEHLPVAPVFGSMIWGSTLRRAGSSGNDSTSDSSDVDDSGMMIGVAVVMTVVIAMEVAMSLQWQW